MLIHFYACFYFILFFFIAVESHSTGILENKKDFRTANIEARKRKIVTKTKIKMNSINFNEKQTKKQHWSRLSG